ncbi:formylglycine-generating enzyme family protein [Sphingomonas nostoxanthinifaciens]|uniref:formylglycine-generating enzyme family protein n=1 Tax=Sphingomonas nostoxanthinifaciens TaxID=2872652 RepID=UPI001CC1C9CB|nr:formylglycine-generating enzyme family protein [Sphingomonas nostoxanthinifaciens]UAK25357.1 formylglycine-generating enzyme family protein [Sphingomonas nostoxanthinifaciens]
MGAGAILRRFGACAAAVSLGLLLGGAARQPHMFHDCPDCPEMVVIPAGHVAMGSPPDEPGHKPDEEPQTNVAVRSIAVGRFAVTRAQWRVFVEASSHPDGLGCAYSGLANGAEASWRKLGFAQTDHDPVVCISWAEAQDYVRWLSARTGRPYRLLTEAEWEYAARAGTTTAFPWGAAASHDFANYGADECCTPATAGRDRWLNTAPVGSFPPNGFGLSDMIGNVWQWVQDCYVDTLAGRPVDAAAVDAPDCRFRVARGGTWGDPPALIRSAARNYAPPPRRPIADYRSSGFGLRVASDVIASRPPRQAALRSR